MTTGIDVSVHNGTIDWGKAAKKIDFAILRAGFGSVATQKDKNFDKNYNGCQKNGVKVGAYWYCYAKLSLRRNKKQEFVFLFLPIENLIILFGMTLKSKELLILVRILYLQLQKPSVI